MPGAVRGEDYGRRDAEEDPAKKLGDTRRQATFEFGFVHEVECERRDQGPGPERRYAGDYGLARCDETRDRSVDDWRTARE